MSGLLANAPVYYALVQVRFEPVATMAKYVDEIQDRLRKTGFPLFESEQQPAFNFIFQNADGAASSVPPQFSMPMVNTTSIWYFTNSSRTAGYVLGSDFITFQMTAYQGHENYFEQLVSGIKLLNEIVQLGNLTRVGLRYLNAIVPSAEEAIEQYLDPSISGIKFGRDWLQSAWESAYKTDFGVLVAKVYSVSNSPVGTPIDLQIRSVQLPEQYRVSTPVRHAVMDLDHYSDGTLPPDSEALAESLKNLHEGVSGCFSKLATEYAFERWK